VILLALLVPVLMMGILFGTCALEDCLFPRPPADDHLPGPRVASPDRPGTAD
jgi:hypothetical protein